MPKELFIASAPHETKVAVVEDDSLVEVFYQRDTDVGLVGGIYKGRVSRVLPGMQSAFVDIGLERDAFLYVSDFFEDSDEYDRVVADAETRVSKFTAAEAQPAEAAPAVEPSGPDTAGPAGAAEVSTDAGKQAGAEAAASTVPAAEPESEPASPGPSSPPSESRGQQQSRPAQELPGGRGRRRRRGRGRFGRQPFRDREAVRRPAPATSDTPPAGFEILPGESLARYGQTTTETPASSASSLEPEGAASVTEKHPEEDVRASGFANPAEGLPANEDGSKDASAQPEQFEAASAEDAAPPQDSTDSVPAASERLEDEDELLAGNIRVAPLPIEPDTPPHEPASQTAEKEPAETAGPDARRTAAAPALADAEEPEELSSAADSHERFAGVDVDHGEVEASETDLALDANQAEGYEEALPELPDDATQADQGSEDEGSLQPPVSGASDAPAERSYTMRDQHQRPRFAPRRGRRGRGRFGGRGPRGEGQGRRPDFPRAGNEQPVQINEVLKEGQEILVQIAKEPLGTKGARITSHIALPGRYLVFMPTIHHIGVSRKIGTEEERLRLRNIILEHRGSLTGGIIVRTAAAGRSEEELKADLAFLARLWHEIRERTERSKAPALIHRDLTLVERILRDILSPDFKSVRVDNEVEYQNVLDFVHRFQPSLVGHVKLYTKDEPLFEQFGIQSEIDKALKPKVWLKSGGYIVINQAEALVAIDVNTGKYVGKTNRLEDTIVKTNIDAVKEIVRQVRLRDLGGIVVIDFIDMDDRRNRAKVVQALEEALRRDRAPTKILSFNEFGLVALTRKRVKQSLERTLSEQCPYCTGSGWIKSVTTVCYEIMEEAKRMASEIEGNTLTLRVNPEVARALKSREGVLTAELESLTGKDVVIKSDPTVHHERFEIF